MRWRACMRASPGGGDSAIEKAPDGSSQEAAIELGDSPNGGEGASEKLEMGSSQEAAIEVGSDEEDSLSGMKALCSLRFASARRAAPADSTYPLRVADFHMPSEVKLPRYPDLSVDTLLSVGCHDVKMSGRDDSLLIGVGE